MAIGLTISLPLVYSLAASRRLFMGLQGCAGVASVCIGIWMIAAHTLLAVSVWLRWGWFSTLIAVLGVLGGLLDTAFDLPLVSWPGRITGQRVKTDSRSSEHLRMQASSVEGR